MRVQTGYTVNKIQARLELEGRSPSNQPSLPRGKRLKRWGVVVALTLGQWINFPILWGESINDVPGLKCRRYFAQQMYNYVPVCIIRGSRSFTLN